MRGHVYVDGCDCCLPCGHCGHLFNVEELAEYGGVKLCPDDADEHGCGECGAYATDGLTAHVCAEDDDE